MSKIKNNAKPLQMHQKYTKEKKTYLKKCGHSGALNLHINVQEYRNIYMYLSLLKQWDST